MRAALALAALLLACGIEQDVKGLGADFAEATYCAIAGCGQVFLCAMPDGSKNEWCWRDDSAAELAADSGATSCAPTPRGGALGWPCLYQCPSARGCDAYQGCWCP